MIFIIAVLFKLNFTIFESDIAFILTLIPVDFL